MSQNPNSEAGASALRPILDGAWATLRAIARVLVRALVLLARGIRDLVGRGSRANAARNARRDAAEPTPSSPPFGWEPLRKYSPYRDTLRRHRLLFALPPIVAMLIAIWVVAGAPKLYESTTSLWFDNAPPQASSITQGTDLTGATTPPAAQAQVILNELLTTRDFRTQIGKRGPLQSYLAHNDAEGWGPKALLDSLRGTGALSDRVVKALGPSDVTTRVVGPQVLAVALKSTSPTVAAGTLRALITEFNKERRVAEAAQGTATLAYYRDAESGAQAALATAQRRVHVYVAAHPTATPCASTKDAANSTCDLNLKTLSDAQKAASARLVEATGQYNQASINLSSLPSGSSKILVLDAPRVPTAPVSGPKKTLIAAIAGLFAGFLVSLLAVIGITSAELRTAAGPRDEAEREDGPELAATAATSAVAPIVPEDAAGTSFELADFPESPSPRSEPPLAAPAVADPLPRPRTARDVTLASMIDSDATFSGTVIDVRNDGTGRARRPIWTVRQDVAGGFGPPLGGLVHLAEAPGHDGAVRALRDAGDGRLAFEVEITELRTSRSKTAEPTIPTLDPRWVGTEVTFAVGPSPTARRRQQRQAAASRKGSSGDERPSDRPGKIPSVP